MTEQLTVVAHLRALNGQIEETKTFLPGLIEPTRAEPGASNTGCTRTTTIPRSSRSTRTGPTAQSGTSTWSCRT